MLPSLLFRLLHLWKPYLAKIKLGYSSGLCFSNSGSNWSPCGLLFWPCSEYSAWVHWINFHGDPMRRHCYLHLQEDERLGKYPASQRHPVAGGDSVSCDSRKRAPGSLRWPEFKSYRSWGRSDEVDRGGGDYVMVWWGLGSGVTSREKGSITSGLRCLWRQKHCVDSRQGSWPLWPHLVAACGEGVTGRKDVAENVSKSWRQISNCTSQSCGA